MNIKKYSIFISFFLSFSLLSHANERRALTVSELNSVKDKAVNDLKKNWVESGYIYLSNGFLKGDKHKVNASSVQIIAMDIPNQGDFYLDSDYIWVKATIDLNDGQNHVSVSRTYRRADFFNLKILVPVGKPIYSRMDSRLFSLR